MDAAHLGLIVVDQPDELRGVRRFDCHLFPKLAAHSFFVGARGGGVVGRDVSADADAPLGVQAGLPLPLAAGVLKQVHAPRTITVAKNDVRNELLERRILLHGGPGTVARVSRVQEAAEVAIHIAAEALEVPQAMKHGGGNDENMFRGDS